MSSPCPACSSCKVNCSVRDPSKSQKAWSVFTQFCIDYIRTRFAFGSLCFYVTHYNYIPEFKLACSLPKAGNVAKLEQTAAVSVSISFFTPWASRRACELRASRWWGSTVWFLPTSQFLPWHYHLAWRSLIPLLLDAVIGDAAFFEDVYSGLSVWGY